LRPVDRQAEGGHGEGVFITAMAAAKRLNLASEGLKVTVQSAGNQTFNPESIKDISG